MNRHEMNVQIFVFVPELGLQSIKLVKQRKVTAIKLNSRAINQVQPRMKMAKNFAFKARFRPGPQKIFELTRFNTVVT